MNPILFQIWGPFAIHAYGVCIAVGVLVAFMLLMRDKKLLKIISFDQIVSGLQCMILAGYVGGRLGFLSSEGVSDYSMIFKFWEPGLSILGGVLGILIALRWYAYIKKIVILSYLDRLVIYAPLVQSFGRLGCFFAGCCYGLPFDGWCSVTYRHANHMAPLFVSLHPAQLYSAVILFLFFLLFYFDLQYRVKISGILLCCYLIAIGAERFLIDFIRWDRVFCSSQYYSFFSVHQWIALGIVGAGVLGIVWLKKQSKKYGSV